jgi:hypothetical protein
MNKALFTFTNEILQILGNKIHLVIFRHLTMVIMTKCLWRVLFVGYRVVYSVERQPASQRSRSQWATQHYIPEDATLLIHCCENLKSYISFYEVVGECFKSYLITWSNKQKYNQHAQIIKCTHTWALGSKCSLLPFHVYITDVAGTIIRHPSGMILVSQCHLQSPYWESTRGSFTQ